MRDSELREYSREWLQYERQQPMYDESIDKFWQKIFTEMPKYNNEIDEIFISTFVNWLLNHKFSNFKGIENFPIKHIIQGCTHFIDDLYQRCGDIQTFEKDYKYHWRLNNKINYVTIDTLDPSKELLIAMPFPYYGDIHPEMNHILNRCYDLNIPVHVDSAWISCIRDIDFNFDHPAIKSFAVSLSKAGIGNNRIGVRFSREKPEGSITIMNEFNMNQQPLVYIGLRFMQEFGTEHFWKKYEKKYYKICKDFNLSPTKTVHIALDNNKPVGIRSLLRAL